jgi:hypothetical protein
MNNAKREEKYQQFVRGWINYFRLADMKKLLQRTDEWGKTQNTCIVLENSGRR